MLEINVTAEQLRDYWQRYHEVLQNAASRHLAPSDVKRLAHVSALPAEITVLASTQFGVAIEYRKAERTTWRLAVSSRPIEEALLEPPRAVCRMREMLSVRGTAGVAELTLEGAFPFRLATDSARIVLSNVGMRVGAWSRTVEYAELYANRKLESWTTERATERAYEEVLAARTELDRAAARQVSIERYIENHKQRTVLVLGSYDHEGAARLEAIANALTECGYDPLLVRDVKDYPSMDLRQKVVALASISRFVVVDDSAASGHLTELELCQNNRWVTVVLRPNRGGSSWMTAGLGATSKVLNELGYSEAGPAEALPSGVQWAEETLKELQLTYMRTYPWRQGKAT